MTEETITEQRQREISEIADVLLRRYYPPGTMQTDVWAEALEIHRMQFTVDSLEALPSEEGKGGPA